ncbi:hypothetical protein [Flagellimonas crocea]|uniref:hypothetical protein n=1 Tax=Flagellimonas crocea TaxID=3067311 RepID=UPI00297003A0|nr:hypothetical protein [Muricauda sp. DH64]
MRTNYIIIILTAGIAVFSINGVFDIDSQQLRFTVIILSIFLMCFSMYEEYQKRDVFRYIKNFDTLVLKVGKKINKSNIYFAGTESKFVDADRLLQSTLFTDLNFQCKLYKGRILVDIDILDNSGKIIAMMRSNLWKVGGRQFDYNYDKNGLEILNEEGLICFQIYKYKDGISIGGIFYTPDGRYFTIMKPQFGPKHMRNSAGVFYIDTENSVNYNQFKIDYKKMVKPIFVFPTGYKKGKRV